MNEETRILIDELCNIFSLYQTYSVYQTLPL